MSKKEQKKMNKKKKRQFTNGKLPPKRALKKEQQLSSLLRCILAMLPQSAVGPPSTRENEEEKEKLTIVDFAGGTGHLAIPLAVLLPKCKIVIVDLKKQSLDLVHEKVKGLSQSSSFCNDNDNTSSINNNNIDPTLHSNIHQSCAPNLPNLYTYHGSISFYTHPFDLALSLHACGEASDLVLQQCLLHPSTSFIISPCCVGKLNTDKFNPYVYHATSANDATVSYPQSTYYKQVLNIQRTEYNVLAKAADYSEMNDMRSSKNAVRRVAKTLLEWDRLLWVQEEMNKKLKQEKNDDDDNDNDDDGTGEEKEDHYGYEVALTRMQPWECSPKNDILLGWNIAPSVPKRKKNSLKSPYGSIGVKDHPKCKDCDADIEATLHHLFSSSTLTIAELHTYQNDSILSSSNPIQPQHDQVDWTKEEEKEIHDLLLQFLQEDEQDYYRNSDNKKILLGKIEINSTTNEETNRIVYKLPKGMGKKKRKIVHYVAEYMGLIHWCEGKKMADKIVVVAKKRQTKGKGEEEKKS